MCIRDRAMFVQNAEVGYQLTSHNSEIWIENSYVGAGWNIHHQTIITGVPANNWNLEVPMIDVAALYVDLFFLHLLR